MPVTSTPPPARKPASPPKPAAENQVTKDRREALTGFAQIAQLPLVGYGLLADAATVGQYGPQFCAELANLAGKYEQVAAFVDPLIKVGPFTAIISVGLQMTAQFAVNHKRIPPGVMGTVPPESLAAQMELAIAREQARVMAEQAAAERELRNAREEIAQMQEPA